MKQILRLFTVLFAVGSLSAQTTLLDFETAGTSTTYQYFGSSLDGTLNNIIANPDASGANTSSMVAEHIKAANSQTWAGAFPNPAMPIAADMVTNNLVCIKVWAPAAGNVGIKLEGATTTGNTWIRTANVSQAQTWVEVCVDASLPSIEAPFLPATGHVYPTVTLFFDFGTAFPTDMTYYWDDLVTKMGGGAVPGDITFSVDMNSYAGAFTKVYVSGTFNAWSADANPLSDSNGDGIWETTIADVPPGLQEYKFQLDGWAAQEEFNGFETCIQVDPSGQFVNRKLVVAGDEVLPTFCYNSCYACGDGVKITFALGASHITVSNEGLYVAGGGNFGNPGDFPLQDGDGDGVWIITLERQKGFSSFYAFTNGACPDYSCKENIAGQDCANPGNFNDRFLSPVTQDTTVATCFEICTTDTECGAGNPGIVKFSVDMSAYSGTYTNVYIAGNFNGWSGDANPLTDADGDKIYETSLSLQPGTYEYKFELDNWAVSEEFMNGDPCTIADPSGQFINRVIEVDGDQEVCFLWNTCTSCLTGVSGGPVFDANLFSLTPTMADEFTLVQFNTNSQAEKSVRLIDATGAVINLGRTNDTIYRLTTGHLVKGIYFVQVQSGHRTSTQKFIKQ